MLSAWAVVLEGPGLLSARCRVALAVECETRHGDSVVLVVLVVLLFFGGSGLFPRFASLACARSRARHGAVVYLYIYVRIITLSVLNCSI